MEWAIAAGLGIIGTIVVGLVYYFVVGPKEQANGADGEHARQQAKADGLQDGAEAMQRMVDEQLHALDKQLTELKARNPIEIANDIIQRRQDERKKP